MADPDLERIIEELNRRAEILAALRFGRDVDAQPAREKEVAPTDNEDRVKDDPRR